MRRMVCFCLFAFAFLPVTAGKAAPSVSGLQEQWESLTLKVIEAHGANDFQKAIDLAEKALEFALENFGQGDHNTLISTNNLANLHVTLGQYGKAEPLYKKALRSQGNLLSRERPELLTTMNNLAGLYESQGRYDEAEPLYRQAAQMSEIILGPEDPSTLECMNDLALLYVSQERYHEAEALNKRVLGLREKVLGPEHPDTLVTVNNMAFLYSRTGRYETARPLYEKVLRTREKVLDKKDSSLIASMNNLAFLEARLGEYEKAGNLYRKAIRTNEAVLGSDHPRTISARLNYCQMMAASGKTGEAFNLLKKIEGELLSRTFQELCATASQRARRLYMEAISGFQDTVFSFAISYPDNERRQYAADVLLRWKHVDSEEDAYIHGVLHSSGDPEMERLREEISVLRAKLSWQIHNPANASRITSVREELEAATRKLKEKTRRGRSNLAVTGASMEKIRENLPPKSALLEFRQYTPVDFKSLEFKKPHWVAVLVDSDSPETVFRDLGEAMELDEIRKSPDTDTMYWKLFTGFTKHMNRAETLFIAPDGILNLISFSSLVMPNGKFLVQRYRVNRLLTGRDLMDKSHPEPSNMLVAVGGVDYGRKLANNGSSNEARAKTHAPGKKVTKLAYLAHSKKEADVIAEMYELNVKGGRALVYQGNEATEQRIKKISAPPKIMHLATHGFYLNNRSWAKEEPMALSGLAFADANPGLQGILNEEGDDGLLYALEVLGLNLRGTELVSLSACDSGKGVVDYSEGVYGLVRAFRTVGAKSVLMALSKVGDLVSKEFMITFYHTLLCADDNPTPAEAMHRTRLRFIEHPMESYRKPEAWAPFVLIGR